MNTRRRYLDVLSCVYGTYQPEDSMEHMIRNKWTRDMLARERELEFFKTQYLVSATMMTLTQKSDVVLSLHEKFQNLTFPWEKPEKEAQATSTEDAVQRFQEMQKSGTIDAVKRDVSVDTLFKKWRDPLQDEESK